MSDKLTILKVTIEEQFYIPMHDDERTAINGWTLEEVVADWFKNYPMDVHHATRDGHRIGNSRKFIEYEILDTEGNPNEKSTKEEDETR